MYCMDCGQGTARARGLCAACYIRAYRMIADSKATDLPVTWEHLEVLGKAMPSRRRSAKRRLILAEIQDLIRLRKRSAERKPKAAQPRRRAELSEEEVMERIARVKAGQPLE